MTGAAGASALARAPVPREYQGAALRGAAAKQRGAQPKVAPGPLQEGNSVFNAAFNAAAQLGFRSKAPRRRLVDRCPALSVEEQDIADRVAKDVSRIASDSILWITLSKIKYTKQDGTPGTLQGLVNDFINAQKKLIDKGKDNPYYFYILLNDLRSCIDPKPDTAELTSRLSELLNLNNKANFPNEDVRDELIKKVVAPFIDTINKFLDELEDLVGKENPTGDDLTSKVSTIASKCAELKTSLKENIKTLQGSVAKQTFLELGDDFDAVYNTLIQNGILESIDAKNARLAIPKEELDNKLNVLTQDQEDAVLTILQQALQDNIGGDVEKAFYSAKYHGAIEGLLLPQNATTVKDLNKKIEEWAKLNNCKDKLLHNYQDKVKTIRTSMVKEFKALIPKDINSNNIDKNIKTISQLLEIVSQDNGLFDGTQKTEVTDALKAVLKKIASQIGSKVNDLNKKVKDNSESHPIATIKDHASEFSRLNNQVAGLSALNQQHLNNDPIGPIDLGTSQSSLKEIKAKLIEQLFSLNLIKDGTIPGGTINAIKEIMTNLQASPNDLSNLDTIKKIPQLKVFVESIEQCVDDYSVVSAQKTNLNDIKTALTRLHNIIKQHANSEDLKAFPGLTTLLNELETQLNAILECEEQKDDYVDDYIIFGVSTVALCCCCCCCLHNCCNNPDPRPSPARDGSMGASAGRNPADRPDHTVFGRRV